jgi:hypothetical protein
VQVKTLALPSGGYRVTLEHPSGAGATGELMFEQAAATLAWDRLRLELLRAGRVDPTPAERSHISALAQLATDVHGGWPRCFSAARFAVFAWPDSEGWSRVSNCGPHGSTSGISMGRAAGSVLRRYVHAQVLTSCDESHHGVGWRCYGYRFAADGPTRLWEVVGRLTPSEEEDEQ